MPLITIRTVRFLKKQKCWEKEPCCWPYSCWELYAVIEGAEQFQYTFRKVASAPGGGYPCGDGRFQRHYVGSPTWEAVVDDAEVQELQGLLSDEVHRMWVEFEEKIAGASPLCFTLADANDWQNLSRLTHETCAEEIQKNRFRDHHVYDFEALDLDLRATTHTVSPFFVYCLKSEHMLNNEIFVGTGTSPSTPASSTKVELPLSRPSKWGLCRKAAREEEAQTFANSAAR